jgi:hypothetical protein
MERDYTKERNDKCIPVVWEIMKIISENKGKIGEVTKEDYDSYNDLQVKVLTLFKEKDLTQNDITYIKALLLQAVELPYNLCSDSILRSYDKAVEKIWGKEEIDISVSDIDKVLKAEKVTIE